MGLHPNSGERSSRTFIESAVEYARQDYRENWKFAVLHLNTALELLLKARLALDTLRSRLPPPHMQL
jgi:hypothetical protein